MEETTAQSAAESDPMQALRGPKGPAWRWELAGQLPPRRTHRLVQHCDQDVRDAHHYFQLCRHGADGARWASAKYPLIIAANALNEDQASYGPLRILVLGGCPRQEIAARLGLEEQVIEVWERLFFDVRGSREAVVWVHLHIVQAERNRGNGHLASQFKLAVAGPAAARAILDAESRVPLQEGERLFDQQLELHLKFDQAMEMPLTSSRQQFWFIRFYSDLRIKDRRLKLQRARLEARCQESLQKHQLAEARLQASRERGAREAAERERKTQSRQRALEAKRKAREQEARLQRDRGLAEQQRVRDRSAASPLAQLKWRRSAFHALPILAGGIEAGLEKQHEEIATVCVPITAECCVAPSVPDDWMSQRSVQEATFESETYTMLATAIGMSA